MDGEKARREKAAGAGAGIDHCRLTIALRRFLKTIAKIAARTTTAAYQRGEMPGVGAIGRSR